MATGMRFLRRMRSITSTEKISNAEVIERAGKQSWIMEIIAKQQYFFRNTKVRTCGYDWKDHWQKIERETKLCRKQQFERILAEKKKQHMKDWLLNFKNFLKLHGLMARRQDIGLRMWQGTVGIARNSSIFKLGHSGTCEKSLLAIKIFRVTYGFPLLVLCKTDNLERCAFRN